MKRISFFFISLLGLFFLSSKTIYAREAVISVVNPVRISSYTINIAESIKAQALVTRELAIPATWLITHEILENESALQEIKSLPQDHEIGLFLEISEALARKAGVTYKKPDYWYHPKALFLSGYTQDERVRLIDTLFSIFKERLGYTPTSVGSWWTDSFSLDYMQKTYGITANLMCSDQYATDNYQLWGQYWGAPFYPSKIHAGNPGTADNKIDVVMMPWALRDPLHGYQSSLYSTQDYFTTTEKLDETYFQKILHTYLFDERNPFGLAVIGLEGDFNPENYSEQYKTQLTIAKGMRDTGKIKIQTMKDFSTYYRNQFGETPQMQITAPDLLGGNTTTEWVNSPYYRVGLRYRENANEVTIFDIRAYDQNFKEPYYSSPNRDSHLSIVLPGVLDSYINPSSTWTIPLSRNDITFQERSIVFRSPVVIPNHIQQNNRVQSSRQSLSFLPWKYPIEGVELRAVTPEAWSVLGSNKARLFFLAGCGGLILLFVIGYKKQSIILALFIVGVFFIQGTDLYLVTPGELDALSFLKTKPEGVVLVPDTECLQCEYHTTRKPIFMVNSRGYVSLLSQKPIVYSNTVFQAQREEIKETLTKTNARYLYLTKFESYTEELPYSPGDSGVKKIFENANVTIWERE